MATDMPSVKDCAALDCSNNAGWLCRAPEVAVGKEGKPACTTYRTDAVPESADRPPAAVGACEMHMCLRNRELRCNAYRIKVRLGEGGPLCRSFKNRYR